MVLKFRNEFSIQPQAEEGGGGGGGGSQPSLKRTVVLEEEINIVPLNIRSYTVVPNVTTTGDVSEVNGVLSNFSTTAYASAEIQSLGNNPWEFECKITTGADTSTAQEVVGISTKGASIYIASAYIRLYLSSDGTNWDIANNTSLFKPSTNTTWQLKLVYDGTKYELYRVYTGTWQLVTTINSSTPINWDGNLWFGINQRGGTPSEPFLGSIDLKDCKLTSNNVVIWQGATEVE